MAQSRPPYGNHPITLQQKQTLIEVYERTRNMPAAMREAGIQSPRTAYLWWHRYLEGGPAGLQPRSHARHTQERLPDSVVEQICQIRREQVQRQEPLWGRRQIANALTRRDGRQVASPASVENVLRRAGLWEPSAQPAVVPHAPDVPWLVSGGVDYERLLETIYTGIQLSLHSEARVAAVLLYEQVWRPLEADPSLSNKLLASPAISSWLLGSRLHLGHCLFNTGDLSRAEHQLRAAIDWMDDRPVPARQRAWEEEPHMISLRRDDVWLGCVHHLALVLGKSDVDHGLAMLQTALHSVNRLHRPVRPGDRAMIGGLERDLAHLKLRSRHLAEAEIRDHLTRAQEYTEDAGSGPRTFTHFAWAKLYSRLALDAGERERETRRRYRNLMEEAVERALQLVEGEQEDRPMRQTLCLVDAAQLFQANGMPVDWRQVRRAAEYCLTYGYAHQAQELLAIPGIRAHLSDEAQRDLENLS